MTASTVQSFLAHEPADFIGGEFRPVPGVTIRSHNPAAPDETVWQGGSNLQHVDEAIASARAAQSAWARTPIEQRIEALLAFKAIAADRKEQIGQLIQLETGKAAWDAQAEAGILAGKIDITLDEGQGSGRNRVTGFDLELSPSRSGQTRFRPHGVMAVVGPFNFPAHLPNGHIIPALLMGNTVVFKPSDKTPAVGQLLAEMYLEALDSVSAPKGVFNLIQGGADIASRLVTHEGIDGILFTGSWPVGRRILEANLDSPGRIVALELGGNNGALVMPDADLKATAIECARAAFITTGQRCTCTRRLIVHKDIASQLVTLIAKIASNLVVGDPAGVAGSPVFCGPLIREEPRAAAMSFQQRLAAAGAAPILEATAMDTPTHGHYITPGMWSVDSFSKSEDVHDAGCDVEIFGPIMRITECTSLDDGIAQVNATRYGLAASIFTTDDNAIDRFLAEARAGCVNVNTGTAGASGKLPFGGLGLSGNHRPAGSFALDYCAYPVASMVETAPAGVLPAGMTFNDSWLS